MGIISVSNGLGMVFMALVDEKIGRQLVLVSYEKDFLRVFNDVLKVYYFISYANTYFM